MDAPVHHLTLELLPDRLMVCRLPAEATVPEWAQSGSFFALVRTDDELSVVCMDGDVPEGIPVERNWRALKVAGPLEFSMVGVLASLAKPLSRAGVSIFVISTYDTDYVLVKEHTLTNTLSALQLAGHRLMGEANSI